MLKSVSYFSRISDINAIIDPPIISFLPKYFCIPDAQSITPSIIMAEYDVLAIVRVVVVMVDINHERFLSIDFIQFNIVSLNFSSKL